MANNIQAYELDQEGKKYLLTTEIKDNKLKIACYDKSTSNSTKYFAEYTLYQLQMTNACFQQFVTIEEVQKKLNDTIEAQQIGITEKEGQIRILFYLNNSDKTTEDFFLQLNQNAGQTSVIYNSPQVYQTVAQTGSPIRQVPEQGIDQVINMPSEIYFAPPQRLPTVHVDITPANGSVIYSPAREKNNDDYINTILQSPEVKYSQSPEIKYSKSPEIQTQNYQNLNTYFQSPEIKYITNTTVPPPTSNYFTQGSPVREQIQYVPVTSPRRGGGYEFITTTQNKNNFQYVTSTENVKDPTKAFNLILSPKKEMQQVYPSTSYNIVDFNLKNQNEDKIQRIETDTNKIRQEHINLKNQLNQLLNEIKNLRAQNQILIDENNALKQKNGSSLASNEKEINMLKQENQRLVNQYDILKNQYQKELDELNSLKQKEIDGLKIQINELLENQKKMEDFRIIKQKEIDELKLQLDKLLKSQLRSPRASGTGLDNQIISVNDVKREVVRGEIIHSMSELEMITRKINKLNKKIILNLLYKATVDSDKAVVFHSKCDGAESSLVLVESKNGKRFGGYTSCNWRGNSVEKKDEEAFIFSLDKMQIYEIISGEDAIGCYPKYGPVFLGCQIRIYDDAFTKGGSTFERGLNYNTLEDFELTGGLKQFEVKEIEVYGVVIE